MAKHRQQQKSTARRIATASALAVGATIIAPGAAQAATITVPGINHDVDVPGAEAISQYVPQADRFIQGSSELSYPGVDQVELPVSSEAPAVSSVGQQIVDIAYSKIGSPYVYGAAGPDSFDCSGFTSWVYSQVGKSIPRTSQAQAAGGTPVAKSDLQPGDIVAFYGGASHVGIYVGDGKIVDALNSGTPVGERPLDMMPFHSAVRF